MTSLLRILKFELDDVKLSDYMEDPNMHSILEKNISSTF